VKGLEMKKQFSCLVSFIYLLMVLCSAHAQQDELTTIVFVRHAEKAGQLSSSSLTIKGKRRAKELAYFLKDVKLNVIYSTPFKRTLQTAEPVAESQKLKITERNDQTLETLTQFIDEIIGNHTGQTVLIVNHSNLIYAMIDLIKKEEVDLVTAKRINEKVYDNIFIVTFYRRENARVLQLKYGEPTPLK